MENCIYSKKENAIGCVWQLTTRLPIIEVVRNGGKLKREVMEWMESLLWTCWAGTYNDSSLFAYVARFASPFMSCAFVSFASSSIMWFNRWVTFIFHCIPQTLCSMISHHHFRSSLVKVLTCKLYRTWR